ncbi:MAG: type II secretion system protein [Clostridia bacterium]|nr:type II secretion system protein [Clostridia bacterium]
MKKLNKKGFTIVELVIVIAVIAILAAVLIPTFATVIKKANDSAALQAARNEFSNYLAGIEAKDVSGKVGGTYVVEADSTHFFVIKAGEMNTKVFSTKPTAETTELVLAGSTATVGDSDITVQVEGCNTAVKIYEVTYDTTNP